jgi:glycosyltransferase involved in cell wall biosynthesis
MTASPEVSVVIPTRNRWHLLAAAALPSALAQVGVPLEVIVVDDGSTDETPARLAALLDPRVRHLRHESSRGVAAARNAGIEAARGEWVALLDDDDLWSPVKLQTQVAAARAAGADFVYGSALVLDEERRPVETSQAPAAADLRTAMLRRYAIPAGASNVVAKTELLRRLGGFDERVSYLADWDMWLRLATEGIPASCPEVVVGYIRHPDRMLVSKRQALDELDYVLRKHERTGLRIDPVRFLTWVAVQHREAGRRLAGARMFFAIAAAYRRPYHVLRAGATLLEGLGGERGRLVPRRGGAPEGLAPPAEPEWLARLRQTA